jgi:hypothetical protein
LKKSSFKSFSLICLFSLLSLIIGCVKSPTSPNSGQWGEATAHAFSQGRYGLAGAVYNGQMWAMGGASGPVTTYYSDVYSSGNGSNWTKINGNAPFGGRYGSQVLSFNGELWLIAGNNSGTLRNDVWNSTDGANWTRVLAPSATGTATQFSPREDFGAVVNNGLMWVIGGFDGAGGRNDVWSSPDGVNWTLALADGAGGPTQFSKRWGLSSLVYNNSFWVIGGANGPGSGLATAAYGDVWNSNNGSTWTQVTNKLNLTYYDQTVSSGGLIVLTLGYVLENNGPQDWLATTSDGINWNNTTATYPARFYHLSLAYNNQVWVIGGCDNICTSNPCPTTITYYNDVWFTQ